MVKLASAREMRMYGPRPLRNRSEYINAGLYVFATIVLGCAIATQWSSMARSGLVLAMIALLIIVLVNVHDLVAHLAGIDYRLPLVELDLQLALVEFAAPLVFAVGTLLLFLATIFLFILAGKGRGHNKLARHAINLLIAGPVLWLLGSIHNSCQIYERADGTVQILQQSVHIPFMMASLLFLVGGIINSREQIGHDGLHLLGESWIWLCVFGSILLFVGAVANVLKVFETLRGTEPRLEKLRGGAQERLVRTREGQVPLLREEQQGPVSRYEAQPRERQVPQVREEQKGPVSRDEAQPRERQVPQGREEQQGPVSRDEAQPRERQVPQGREEQQGPVSRDEAQPRERQVPQGREEQQRQHGPASMEDGQSGVASKPYKDVLVG